MNEFATFRNGRGVRQGSPRLGFILSMVLHAVAVAALFFGFQGSSIQIVAAGPGEGGEGGGGAIEVGVADPSSILGFAKPQPVSYVGNEAGAINNARLETARRENETPEEVLPNTDRDRPNPDAVKTERPVANQQERIFTGKEERGGSAAQTAQVGRSYGSPTPAVLGGVGLGTGGGLGVGTGLPGGSAYGRIIQGILSRNYSPPAVDTDGVQYVVMLIRVSRDGAILSLSNGRVSPVYIKQRSSLAIVNNAAERAVLASNPLPAFPPGFLTGAKEAVAEVWFRYPK